MTKLAIVGCRTFEDYSFIKIHVDAFINDNDLKDIEIVSGGASGVDTLAKLYAQKNNLPYKEFAADWKTHGRAAGPIRNKLIVEYSDYIIAFWDYVSKGTKSTINISKTCKKPCLIIKI